MMVDELSGAICIGNQIISSTIWVGGVGGEGEVEGFCQEE